MSTDPAFGRYVDGTYQPLDPAKLRSALTSKSKEDALLAVAKRMPVRMPFRVDQRKLNKVLAECGNSKLPVEVRQVRINRPADSGMGMGGYGGSDYGYGESGRGGMSMPGGMGVGGRIGSPVGEGSSDAAFGGRGIGGLGGGVPNVGMGGPGSMMPGAAGGQGGAGCEEEGQVVTDGLLPDFGRFPGLVGVVPLDGQGRGVGEELGEGEVGFLRGARGAVVHRERAQQGAVPRQDRGGPAGREPGLGGGERC